MAVLTPNIKANDPLDGSRGRSLQPRHDAQLKGTVTLDLTKETRFKRITVVLVRL
jgi:hypothetical protein